MSENTQSWSKLREFVESYPEESWGEWKHLARRFLQYGFDRNFPQYFRAGQSMHDFIFSTLDQHGLRFEPRVTVSLQPPEILTIAYWPGVPAAMGDTSLEYELRFDEAMPTFQRFLNHLWLMTKSDPLPPEMRSPEHSFVAPFLPAAMQTE